MNTDRYLALKQGICMYQAIIHNLTITIDDKKVELDKLVNELLRLLDGIQKDFTIPTTLLERKVCTGVIVDFVDSYSKVLDGCFRQDLTYSIERIQALIYQYPDFRDLNKAIENPDDQEWEHTNLKQITGQLIGQLEEGIERLRAAFSLPSTESISKLLANTNNALLLVNFIHTADYMFDYINNRYGA